MSWSRAALTAAASDAWASFSCCWRRWSTAMLKKSSCPLLRQRIVASTTAINKANEPAKRELRKNQRNISRLRPFCSKVSSSFSLAPGGGAMIARRGFMTFCALISQTNILQQVAHCSTCDWASRLSSKERAPSTWAAISSLYSRQFITFLLAPPIIDLYLLKQQMARKKFPTRLFFYQASLEGIVPQCHLKEAASP